ncbi:MAG: glycosyltransferase [Crocinitomicaceae bacterium]|nr:glycosyltransferase [Crocinitomicaceae bacterium]
MIKVLRIINRFNLGGPTYNATFLTAFISDDFETKLIGGKHEEHEGESTFIPENYGVKYELIEELQREISFKADRKALKKIREIIREYKPDVVHTHASKAGFVGRYAAYKEGVPVIVHTFHGHVFHSYFGSLKTSLFKSIERFLAIKTDAIIAISELQKQELTDKFQIAKPDKFRIIPLGFDLSRFQVDLSDRKKTFRSAHSIKDDEITIGIIGRLTAIKNHQLFIDSIDYALQNSDKKIRVFIIGDGELMSEIKESVKVLEDRIGRQVFIFTSWIKQIETALPGLDLVCLTSLNEGTPVSLIEAQAAQVPVITTNVGGVKDVVKDGETGIIINSFDPKDFGSAILSLVDSSEKREKMSQNGWNHVREKYHYQRLCNDVEQLYKELLKKKGVIK